jgi:hypothetical protein
MERYELAERVKQLLDPMTTEEMSYTIGRYCGMGNELLCRKKFGFDIPVGIAIDFLEHRLFEDALLLSSDPDKIEK